MAEHSTEMSGRGDRSPTPPREFTKEEIYEMIRRPTWDVVDRYIRSRRGALLSLAGGGADAEVVLADVGSKIFAKLERQQFKIGDPSKLKRQFDGYVDTAIVNTRRTLDRGKKSQRRRERGWALRQRLRPREAETGDSLANRELMKRVHDRLKRLDERDQQIVRLRMNGVSFDRIGKQLGMSRQSVQELYARRMRKLGWGLEDDPEKQSGGGA